MIKTGIFGGSFNPIHLGHIGLAQHILQQKLVDQIWLMVSPQNPLKSDNSLMDENLRLKLAEMSVKNFNNIFVSDFEFNLPKPSFTFNTLSLLSKQYPDRSFYLIIGADNWCNFSKWANYENIIDSYPILIYPRPTFKIDQNTLPKTVQLLSTPLFPWSSTQIRDLLRTGKDVQDMVPAEIINSLKEIYK